MRVCVCMCIFLHILVRIYSGGPVVAVFSGPANVRAPVVCPPRMWRTRVDDTWGRNAISVRENADISDRSATVRRSLDDFGRSKYFLSVTVYRARLWARALPCACIHTSECAPSGDFSRFVYDTGVL